MQSLETVICQYLVKLNIHVTIIQQLLPGVYSRETLPTFIGRSVYYSVSYVSTRVGGNYVCL